MNFIDIIITIAEHINIFLSWKILSVALFVSNILLAMRLFNVFNAILSGMDKYIKFSCLIFSILFVYKILADSFLCFLNKRKNKITEKQLQINLLNSILALSKGELAVLKYIFNRPDYSAWLPQNLTAAILLLHKGYIKIISQQRPKGNIFEDMDTKNFYKNDSDILYIIHDDIKKLIKAHQEEITHTWQKIRINKNFNKLQD